MQKEEDIFLRQIRGIRAEYLKDSHVDTERFILKSKINTAFAAGIDLHQIAVKQSSVLYALCQMAAADGKIDEREVRYIEDIFPEVDVMKAIEFTTTNEYHLQDAVGYLDYPEIELLFFLSVKMLLKGNRIHERERDFLIKLREELNIKEESIKNISSVLNYDLSFIL